MVRLSLLAALVLLAIAASSSYAWTTPKLVPTRQLKNAAVAAACGWTLATTGAAAEGDIAAGSKIFEANCAACHAGGQNMINKERTLYKDAIEEFVGLDPQGIQEFIKNSVVHRGAFLLGSKLSDKDFQDVVSYVVDQATGDKW